MSMLKRKRRITLSAFGDYRVGLVINGLNFEGFLTDVSESGLGCIFSMGRTFPDEVIQHPITGVVKNHNEKIAEFKGNIMWNALTQVQNETFLAMGVMFAQSIQIPDELLAMEISANEDSI